MDKTVLDKTVLDKTVLDEIVLDEIVLDRTVFEQSGFEQVCIIGLGLIGASLAQAMRDGCLAKRIVAVDQYLPSIKAAIDENVIDDGSDKLINVVAGSDCIIIAVPVKAVKAVFEDIYTAMQQGLIASSCLLSDVCSTKQNVVQAAKDVFVNLPKCLVPAHPIAGAEHSGFHARRGHLFVNHNVIVCALDSTELQAIAQIIDLWEAVGATVMTMEVAHHDAVLAYTSHLPHLLAFNLVDQLASHNDNMDIFRYAAGGFRDFTRIAASNPTMWHDIFIDNKPALLTALDEYSDYLTNLRDIIDTEDSTALLGILGRAQSARQHFNHMLTGTPYTKTLLSDKKDIAPTKLTHLVAKPSTRLKGNIRLSGDKSISHRSIIIGSLAVGMTTVRGILENEDVLATIQAFRDMGVIIEQVNPDEIVIHGVGINGLQPSRTPLYMGGSETSMRLLLGILSAQRFDSVLTGDKNLSKRSMAQVVKPLRQMGAIIQTTGQHHTAPISITGSDKRACYTDLSQLQGITYTMPVASAQIKSSVLLAGLFAKGQTTIVQPQLTRDHTERMLSTFGYPIHISANTVYINGGGQLVARDIDIPADISLAAYFIVAASIALNSNITLKRVGMNPTRTGIIDVLTLMGAEVILSHQNMETDELVNGEPFADITVKSAVLKGILIPKHLVLSAVDELPILCIAASCAVGQTVINIESMRAKTVKRMQAMMTGLASLGIKCTRQDNHIIIHGKGLDIQTNHAIFDSGDINSDNDYRIAMSFAIAGIRAKAPIVIQNTDLLTVGSPNFIALADSVGMNIEAIYS